MFKVVQALTSNAGLLLWPLVLLALVGLILAFERFLYLHRAYIDKGKFLAGVKALVSKGRLVEALTLCEESPGPITSVVRAGLLHHDEGQESIRHGIQTAALSEIPLLERRTGGIILVANLAPFLGLLGTGISALNAFQRLQVTGPYVNSAVFAGDVRQALVSTILGIAVAALALVGHHFINGRVSAVILDMELVGQEILQFLTCQNELRPGSDAFEKGSPT
ncbi:MAG: MotA/TolQ/ExbB proton channel family protein [Opitutae bacterium]|jgi:biopolymer transport protein ExbB|nr:MotA/TolQ/ExbB proton channel family protein [Opitutae bacterium]MBT4225442.1 MotA/TolQ/ExbB proton channel family protein [Opitutae bacterium]MBT5377856.1 MotA/TolQ/ExbB proton channel family protein [Opitutae bacterium]MBT6463693.1 MotA/TolQ/ExbB proton channel family protein [Opitutae bacterium]MBT6957152.1 MotA/TolQ/ExbB proton channel family protein [Opitutae bacterium]